MTGDVRPALPKLAKGDELVMHSGVPGRRDSKRATKVRVVAVGPKYVQVIAPERFDAYDPKRDKWYVRKFLIEDQKEGPRGSRIGYSATIATAEQYEYDVEHGGADEYLREQGIVLRHTSPWRGHEVALARLMREHEPAAVPDA